MSVPQPVAAIPSRQSQWTFYANSIHSVFFSHLRDLCVILTRKMQSSPPVSKMRTRRRSSECAAHRLTRNRSCSYFLHLAQPKSISVLISFETRYCRKSLFVSVAVTLSHLSFRLPILPIHLSSPHRVQVWHFSHNQGHTCGFDD